jgi:hypothetical protein
VQKVSKYGRRFMVLLGRVPAPLSPNTLLLIWNEKASAMPSRMTKIATMELAPRAWDRLNRARSKLSELECLILARLLDPICIESSRHNQLQ